MCGSVVGSSPRLATTCAQLRIAEIGEVDLVELQIAAAGVREGAHRLAVGRRRGRDRNRPWTDRSIPAPHRGRSGNAATTARGCVIFGVALVCACDEIEVLDHRMRAAGAELADHAQHHRTWAALPGI